MKSMVGEIVEYEPCPYHGSLGLEYLSRSVYASCFGHDAGPEGLISCGWAAAFHGSTRSQMVDNAERAWRDHVVEWFVRARFDPPIALSTVEGWLDEVLISEG